LVPKDHQQQMAYEESNGHVTDNFMWPWSSRDLNALKAQHL